MPARPPPSAHATRATEIYARSLGLIDRSFAEPREPLALWISFVSVLIVHGSLSATREGGVRAGEREMEPNGWYYRRRASEEIMAASRAVTTAARDRRLQLAKGYLSRLQALGEPWPFSDSWPATPDGLEVDRFSFGWKTP